MNTPSLNTIPADSNDLTNNQVEVPGLLPLELALYSGQAAVANTLLQHGAEIDARAKILLNTGLGKNCNDEFEFTNKLQANWADNDFGGETGEAPLLHRALAARKPAAALFLLQHGADVHLTARLVLGWVQNSFKHFCL